MQRYTIFFINIININMLYMFQAVLRSSSGAQKLYTQHRVYAKHACLLVILKRIH